jgi:hypothetical protein
LAYSYDGKNWTGLGNSIFSTGCYKVVSNGVVWVAMGAGGNTIATSTDGMVWTGLGMSMFDGSGIGIDWNGSQWFAVGNGSANTAAISNSVTADSWTGIGNTVFSNMNCVRWMLGSWFVGGDASGGSTIAKSVDGTTWTYISTGLSTTCLSIGWNGREAIATGNGTAKIVSSVDGGITWSTVSTNGINVGNEVEWNGRKWIVATDGTASVNNAMYLSGTMNVFGITGSSSLLTNGVCVGTNSGIGAVVFNNRMYLNGGEKLVVYGPEYYDTGLIPDTGISMNMNLPV